MPHSWLTVWNWNRWTWGILPASMLISYFLSAPVAYYFVNLHAYRKNLKLGPLEGTVLQAILDVYRPALWSKHYSEVYEALWRLEWNALAWCFGVPSF